MRGAAPLGGKGGTGWGACCAGPNTEQRPGPNGVTEDRPQGQGWRPKQKPKSH